VAGAKSPGLGKTGYCKICAHPDAHVFIRGAREGGKKGSGWNAAEAQEAGQAYGLTFNRQTWYTHVEHAKTGEMRLSQAAEKVKAQGLIPVRTTSQGFLESLRDIGMAKALANPENVTIEQALKAVQILESKKDKGSDTLNVLVQFVTNQPPPVVIEGIARDVGPAMEDPS
jgi:hypothetical protein